MAQQHHRRTRKALKKIRSPVASPADHADPPSAVRHGPGPPSGGVRRCVTTESVAVADSCFVPHTSPEAARYSSRAGRRLAGRLIADGGLSDLVASFDVALSEIRKPHETPIVVDAFGHMLWSHAVAYAQNDREGRILPGDDDRPLYWARLAMLSRLHAWQPRFRMDAERLSDWSRRLEWASRGITNTGQPDDGACRILISGFDPFRLQQHPDASNPSGAAVLALSGRVLDTPDGPVRITGVMLPVRYADFDQQLVEKIFRPHLVDGPHQVDLAVSISQGRPGRFDLEVRNGRNRSSGTTRDNDGVRGAPSDTEPVEPVGLADGPQFTESTLPIDAMRAVDEPFPVYRHEETSRLVPGHAGVVTDVRAPEDGAVSVRGGGGFLSNEVAYRVTRLRDELGVDIGCGHIHTPAPSDDDDAADLRARVVDQTRRLLIAAGLTIRRSAHHLTGARDPHTGSTTRSWCGE